ncbi:MAG: pyridoxamine 5'-phosphate oxidase family protein [Spirochaetaceae bacterium]|jgi:uncharacterized pyridoxamine 5'-phosphate oxidase family protein|nr:pyridoxamine 5'-phosphate oxidase family protein [Spirochaetaceae bacterium]
MELDYQVELEKIYTHVGECKIMALATSSQNHPTVRLMSCIIRENKIFFQTGTDLIKYKQICENNRVALCVDNIQMEGIADILGRTNDKKNSAIIDVYKKHYKDSYETYAHNETEVLIEIVLKKIIKWDYENGNPYRIFIDIDSKQARKEMYPIKNIL